MGDKYWGILDPTLYLAAFTVTRLLQFPIDYQKILLALKVTMWVVRNLWSKVCPGHNCSLVSTSLLIMWWSLGKRLCDVFLDRCDMSLHLWKRLSTTSLVYGNFGKRPAYYLLWRTRISMLHFLSIPPLSCSSLLDGMQFIVVLS